MLSHFDTNNPASPAGSGHPAKSGKWRWLFALLAAVLLHVLSLDWANQHIAVLPAADEPKPEIAMVQLPAPAPAAPAAVSKVVVKPKPKPRPQHHAVAPPPSEPEPSLDPAPEMPAATPDASTALSTPDARSAANDQPAAPGDTTVPVADKDADANAKADDKGDDKTGDNAQAPHYKVEFPPPVELKYDVEQVPSDGGHPRYGSGTITWETGGGKYQVTGEADVLFFTVLKFTSEGGFDSYGIAPAMYSEKRFRRSETATHFNRDDRNNISFSASTLSYPIKGGEQDLSSVIWELTGIGRGDHEKFVPGAQIDLFVAGVRDADIWSILVVGPENIDAGDGKTQAWHIVRQPRTGSYDRKIDIWLAPQDQWYPIKIRQTEKNGDYVDMTMKSFHALPEMGAHEETTH